ncbi:uncharacterized protein KY384_002901 [Bacidia gigantensis]|uniref:uncharacterized protein n=1 Tax=Bacidia gigantensis TaxID=2732470 RepID=UPI001D044103|nr:uncharacterized protein KY384_002901 [Bacidia gigantensis]KAG8532416.1 hypothetical protein KY384_002901 [Bacidia gigantensis]
MFMQVTSKSSSSCCTATTREWLDSLPSSSDFTDPSVASTPPKKKRKVNGCQQLHGKRPVLSSISTNIMAPKASQTKKGAQATPSLAPNTPPRQTPVSTASLLDHEKTPTQNNPNPRRPSHRLTRSEPSPQKLPTRQSSRLHPQAAPQIPPFSLLTLAPARERRGGHGHILEEEEEAEEEADGEIEDIGELEVGDEAADEGDEASSDSAASTEVSQFLRLRDYHIQQASFEDEQYAFPPPNLKTLTENLFDIAHGTNTIPLQLKDRTSAASLPLKRKYISESVAKNAAECTVRLSAEDEEAVTDFWKEIIRIKGFANECEAKSYAEPRWNNQVHSRLLSLALAAGRQQNHTWFRNVTTHRITDPEIRDGLVGTGKHATMVDYAILLELSSETIERIVKKLGALRTDELNQSRAKDLDKVILAANIETKVLGSGKARAKGIRQLAIWTIAHFRKLVQLNPGLAWSDLPTLPVVLTESHQWIFFAMRMTGPGELLVHGGEPIASTADIQGIFKVLALIQRLARWCKEEYLVWWEEKILEHTAKPPQVEAQG